jgi:hypothetical protein
MMGTQNVLKPSGNALKPSGDTLPSRNKPLTLDSDGLAILSRTSCVHVAVCLH